MITIIKLCVIKRINIYFIVFINNNDIHIIGIYNNSKI
jgi:hypothetical protein